MDFYIKIENGLSVNHPVALDNLKNLHGEDFEDNYEQLGYLPCILGPAIGSGSPFVVITPVYTIEGNVVTTTQVARNMTAEERSQTIEHYKEISPKEYPSWVFDEGQCIYVPPVEYPNDGNIYQWDEQTTNWILIEE